MTEQAELDMTPKTEIGGALNWLPARDYHQASMCGRYSVCRLTVSPVVWYIAWLKPSTELGSLQLSLKATDAEKVEAIRAMKQLCADHAGARKAAA